MIGMVWWCGLLFACLWWILAEGRLDGWLLGGIAVIAATWASIRLWPATTPSRQPTGVGKADRRTRISTRSDGATRWQISFVQQSF